MYIYDIKNDRRHRNHPHSKVLEIVFSDTDLIVLVQGIVVVDDGVLVAALHVDAAVLGVVVCCLAKFY